MFENLKGLISNLSEGDLTSPKVVRESRKVLQAVKLEAQKLRETLITSLKERQKLPKAPKAPKVKKEKPIKPFTKEQQLGKKELKIPTISINTEE